MKALITGLALITISTAAGALEIGQVAPEVTLQQIAVDNTQSAKSILAVNQKGQYKFIKFFSATCGYCIANVPKVDLLEQKFGQTVTFRNVGIDRDIQLTLDFVNKYRGQLNGDVAIDNERIARKAYNVTSTPTFLILNDKNQVIYKKEHLILSDADLAEIGKILE